MRRPEPYKSAITAASRASTQVSRLSPAALVGVREPLGGGDLNRLRQGLADLWRANRGEGADLALASRSRKRPNERKPAKVRISERPAMSSARRIAMKALMSEASSAAKPANVTRSPQWAQRKSRHCLRSRA